MLSFPIRFGCSLSCRHGACALFLAVSGVVPESSSGLAEDVLGVELFMEHSGFDFAIGIDSDPVLPLCGYATVLLRSRGSASVPVCGYCPDFAATFQLTLMIDCFQLVSPPLSARAWPPCIFQWLSVHEVVSPCLCCFSMTAPGKYNTRVPWVCSCMVHLFASCRQLQQASWCVARVPGVDDGWLRHGWYLCFRR